ncbi:MAG: sulfotransferase [Polyangiaceae bacterium]|nr:sulfotransferase [Polyangiaceae bacterium]
MPILVTCPRLGVVKSKTLAYLFVQSRFAEGGVAGRRLVPSFPQYSSDGTLGADEERCYLRCVDLRPFAIEPRTTSETLEVYFHVGAHKTGTTTFQKLIRENAVQLYRQGIVPVAREIPQLLGGPLSVDNEMQIVRPLRQAVKERRAGKRSTAHAQLKKLFQSIVQDAPSAVFSDEAYLGRRLGPHFPVLYPEAGDYIEALAELFPERRVRIILYIRHQDRLIESNFLHAVKTGYAGNFDTYLHSLNREKLHWEGVADNIARVVGAQNLVVLPFEQIREGFEPFARRFFEIFSRSAELQINPVSANPSLSGVGIRLAQYLSPKMSADWWRVVRQPLQRAFSNRVFPEARLLSSIQRDRLKETYQSDYERTIHKYPGWDK